MPTINLDGSGGEWDSWVPDERRTAPPPSSAGRAPQVGTDWDQFSNRDTASAWLNDLARRSGASAESSDLDELMRKSAGDFEAYQRALEQQYARRGAPVAGATGSPGPSNDPRIADHNVFSDPLTRQYEQMLQQQMAMQQQNQSALQQFLGPLGQQQQQLIQAQQAQYAAQLKALEQAAAAAAQKRSATEAAVGRLTGYINERVGKLQGPAYTGTEQEVLRTQLLDPLERDRTAAQKRAYERVASKGYELDSGVAQQLFQDVDRQFDQQRTSAQGALAQRQIEEQRSREQEAQQLLQYLAGLPDAQARGDLEYVTYVQNLLNQPRQASMATGMAGGTGVAQLMDLPTQPGMQSLSMAELLASLPTQRMNDALNALGVGPSPAGVSNSVIQLLQQQQQQRALQQAQAAQYWGQIGRSFMP